MFRRLFRFLSAFAVLLIVLPIAAGAAYSYAKGWPNSWHAADWSSSGLLPEASSDDAAAIYIMAARLGSLEGYFRRSPLAGRQSLQARQAMSGLKCVGWGTPVRRNAYAPDGRWYSSEPYVVHRMHGATAQALIPKVVASRAWLCMVDTGRIRRMAGSELQHLCGQYRTQGAGAWRGT